MLLSFYAFLCATVISFVLALDGFSHQDLESPNGKICKAKGSCTLGEATADQFPNVNCMCDADCVKYGDCCLDAEYFDAERQRRAISEFQCASISETRLLNGHFIYSIYRKDSCPPSWNDVETRRKCESSTGSNQDPLLITPVTSNKTNVTYGNIYCAYCNKDVSQSDILYWNMGLNCENAKNHSLSNDEFVTSKNTLKYNESASSWQVKFGKEIYKCDVSSYAPHDVKYYMRPCVSTIKTCPATWTDKDFRDRCEAYTIVVYDNRERAGKPMGQAYRNVHCGMCNNVPVHSLECKSNSTLQIEPKVAAFDVSFSILLEFGKKGCKENQVRDDFWKKGCRDVLPASRKECSSMTDNNDPGCPLEASPSPYVSKFKPYFNILTAFGIGISIICLCLHLVVFAVLKELRNLSGKNLASLCFALLVAYCSFVISSLLEGRACFVNAVITYYFFLAAFTWMLVMAFDVWRTLRIATKELRVSSGKQWRKFLIYSFCSWALPAKIVLIALLVELCPLSFVGDQFKPHFGYGTCWFGQGPAILVFFGVPLFLILVCNVSFFLSSAYMIYSSHSMAKYSASPNTKRDFRLYARLALIMGLTWIIGIVAGFVDNEFLWVVFIVLNTSLGLFIFLAFTCRKKILHSLKNLKRGSVLNLPAFSWSMNTSDDGKTSSNQTEKQTSNTYY